MATTPDPITTSDDPNAEFPPHVLREYAFLADGERGALVGPRGDFAWMCAPRWDSDAVFSALIAGRGNYAVTPVGRQVWGGYYEGPTLIWRSRWITEAGVVECREALAFPGDPEKVVVLRQIVAVDHDAKVRIVLDPRSGFGRHVTSWSCDDGIWSGRTGKLRVRWSGGDQATPGGLGHDKHTLVAELGLRAGEHHDLVLEMSEKPLPDKPVDADEAWSATKHAWENAVPELPNNMASSDARRSYAILRGMTSKGGGMVAAATMSLPERAGAGRNYDYRYVWIRDQCFAGQAVATIGADPLLDDAVQFVAQRLLADGRNLKPAYTTLGGDIPDQHEIHLPGYPGGFNVVGNQVNKQFQLDTLGESLLLFAAAGRCDHLDADGWRAAETAADVIAQRWTEPEAGIWELDPRNWTESRLICVAGLRAIASCGAPGPRTRDWLALADKILAETSATSTHKSGRWQRAPDDDGLDAALLLPAIRGGVTADDPRTLATIEALIDELASDYYLYRFRHRAGMLGEAEGAFLLCGFTMALAMQQQGRELEAARWFERNRAACGPPGLFAEEYDVGQRQLRGNLPQAFVHALMFECAARLSSTWRDHQPPQ